MADKWFDRAAERLLHDVSGDYVEASGSDLLGRWAQYRGYWQARIAAGLDPFGRTTLSPPGPLARVQLSNGRVIEGVNFASQDQLALSDHPAIRAAAREAIDEWGLQASGPVSRQGGSAPARRFADEIGALLHCAEVELFSSGWAAAHGAIGTLIRSTDHVLVDNCVQPSLREGAASATRNVHAIAHLSNDAAKALLSRIRAAAPKGGILVVTETVMALDSEAPDLRELLDICRAHEATLLLDVSQDLGALGDDGLGELSRQGVLGNVDVIVGSLARCFGTNGGFVAAARPGLRLAMREFAGPLAHSSALPPMQAAVAGAALRVVFSEDGAARRLRLRRNISRLRSGLNEAGFRILGQPSAMVPVEFGSISFARLMTRALLEQGALVDLIEHPLVSRHIGRWRLLLNAGHEPAHIDAFISQALAARHFCEAAPGV